MSQLALARPRPWLTTAWKGLSAFVAAPASARPLAALRIGLAAVLIVQTLCVLGAVEELYGSYGIIQGPLKEAMLSAGVPRAGWAVEALAPLGVPEPAVLRGLVFVYLASLAGLLAGWHTRVMAVAAFALHLTLKMSSQLSAYGVFELAHIALFYCVWSPVGHAWSVDRRVGSVGGGPSADARLGLRLIQLHLCIVYFASGVEKATGSQWWNGEAVWRAVMRPDMDQVSLAWLADWPLVAKAACWGTLLIEVGYPFLIWPRLTRRWMALATIGMHVGIAVCLGLWAFAGVMIALNAAAFLVPSEGD